MNVNTDLGVACGFMPANGKCDGIRFDATTSVTHESVEAGLVGGASDGPPVEVAKLEFDLCCYPEKL